MELHGQSARAQLLGETPEAALVVGGGGAELELLAKLLCSPLDQPQGLAVAHLLPVGDEGEKGTAEVLLR
jgi:hypothetical protein